jgi:hypothetical protein
MVQTSVRCYEKSGLRKETGSDYFFLFFLLRIQSEFCSNINKHLNDIFVKR